MDKISETFGLPSLFEKKTTEIIVAPEKSDSQSKVYDDFEKVRENLLEVIKDGMSALVDLQGLASASQSDKHYAAYSSLMKTVIDANKELLQTQRSIRDITKDDTRYQQAQGDTINNLFIGTSEELLKLIKHGKNEY